MGDPGSLQSDVLFGRLSVEQGLATEAQVEDCLSTLRKLAADGITPLPKLADLLIRKGYLSARQYEATIHASQHTPRTASAAAHVSPMPPEALEAAKEGANLFGKYVRVRR